MLHWGEFKDFLRRDDGSSTIEAVLWLPVFISLFVLVADATFLFYGQNRAFRIVQDANRQLSVGRLASAEEVETLVLTHLGTIGTGATVQSEIHEGAVFTNLSIPASNLVAVGLFTSLAKLDVSVGASHLIEY